VYRTVGIKAVEPPFEVNTRERTLPGAVEDPGILEDVATELFAEFEGRRIRKVGVRVSNLSFPAGEQASLDGYAGSVGGDDARQRPDGQASLGGYVDAPDGDDGGDPGGYEGQSSLTDF
jgi:DNA polymerase IV (DinB-like DNA polymerase)